MSFLQLENKTYLITGVANKKSVAYFTAKTLSDNGANLIFTVQNDSIKNKVQEMFPSTRIFILDVSDEAEIVKFGHSLKQENILLHGFLHSIAFANYSEGIKPFHETKLKDYLEATTISCFSLVEISKNIKPVLDKNASVVSISISNTRATNYGYMGPIKASLDATVAYLAKSFSIDSEVRFNTIASGPLKTSASAGIPGYVNNYLFAEQLTLRHRALKTQEVANTIVFLLSDASSGINASNLLVDAGMNVNYFDEKAVSVFSENNHN
jgi:enoyl-[acyl-carrier protein] reductase I